MSSSSPPDPKDVEFYAAQAQAWFNTALEHDKSILTLSTAGVGLLVTLLTTIGAHTCLQRFLFALALLAFVVSSVAVLRIFAKNKSYLEDLVANGKSASESRLRQLDVLAIMAFALGVALTAAIGFSMALQSSSRSTKVPDKITPQEALRIAREERILESYAGANRMSPKPDETRSYAGAAHMAPKPGAPTNEQPAVPASEPTSQPSAPAPPEQTQ